MNVSARAAAVSESTNDLATTPRASQVMLALTPPASRRFPVPAWHRATERDKVRSVTGRATAENAETVLAVEPAMPSAASAKADLAAATRVDQYEIVARIGAGAMGVVYRAWDQEQKCAAAIKVLHVLEPGASGCRSLCSLLMREGLTMAGLSHPNLVTVHGVGQFRGCVYVAMELVEGVTLREWSSQPGRSWQDRLRALLDAGGGLAAAHAAGIVHRDFKPDNVLIDNDGRVRVTDFGIARSSKDLEEPDPVTSCECGPSLATARVTDQQAVVGTPRYMAPEQYLGGVDSRADQFSFSVSAWELLYREPPIDGNSLEEVWNATLHAAKREVPANSEVPSGVAKVLRRALASEASRRFPSMVALLEALEQAAQSPG